MEWVAPATGSWRVDATDDAGFPITQIYSGGRYFNHSSGNAPSLRIGSDGFLGHRTERSYALEPIRAQGGAAVGDEFQATCGRVRCTLRVVERIPLSEAARRAIFEVPEDAAWVDRELEPGRPPSLSLRAYWFGPAVLGREAATAVEHRDPDESAYIAFYEFPSARGKTFAMPGGFPPEGEIQLVSQSLDERKAKKRVDALASEPREGVTLASGETAELIFAGELGLYVVTDTTLVSFTGDITHAEARRLARALRPLE